MDKVPTQAGYFSIEEAIEWLRSRGKYALDLKHTRQRWERMQDKPVVPPPQYAKVRKIA